MHATLSFNGLLEGYPQLFDGLVVPDTVDKDTVVNNLLLDTMELEVMISSGPVMARALSVYSAKMLPSWARYAKAMDLEYNPLDMDDRRRTVEHRGTGSNIRTPDLQTSTNTNSTSVNKQDLQTDSTNNSTSTRKPDLTTTGQNSGEDSTTREVVGFDSAQLQIAEKNTTQLGTGNTITSTGTDTTTDNGTTTTKNTGTDTTTNDSTSTTRNSGTEQTESTDSYTDTETLTGRAGASAQSMIAAELSIAAENVCQYIVDDIKHQFCLLVY